jgi:hypothetical protein
MEGNPMSLKTDRRLGSTMPIALNRLKSSKGLRLRPDAAALHRICKAIAHRVRGGWTLERAIRRLARKHSGRVLPSGARLKLHPATLLRHWHCWKGNPTRECFTWNYRAGGSASRVTAQMKRDFINVCGEPGVFGIAGAWRELKRRYGKRPLAGARSFYRILSREEAAEVKRFHAARYEWKRAQLRFADFTRRRGR